MLIFMSTRTILKDLVKENCLIKGFYSSVKDGTASDSGEKLESHISNKDYLTCKKICNKFNMKNMGDYHVHYFNKDVLLLADVFKRFIDTCLKFYKLDPCHYFRSPGLSRNAMLKMTGVELKIVYIDIEKGLSSQSFIFGQAFYCPCKTPFTWFVRVIAWVQAIACTSCQGLDKMKDESEGKIIGEFVGLKSKILFHRKYWW